MFSDVKVMPAFPPAGLGIWNAYKALAATRQISPGAANPVTYEELQAFTNMTLTDLTPWEVEVIMKIDDAVRKVANTKLLKKQRKPEQETVDIPVSNVAGLKAMFRGIKERKAAQLAAMAAREAGKPQRLPPGHPKRKGS